MEYANITELDPINGRMNAVFRAFIGISQTTINHHPRSLNYRLCQCVPGAWK